jgi:hypothetical protein
VTRAEVEETTFAIKRELAAIKQHDLDTNAQLEEAKERIRKLSDVVEVERKTSTNSMNDMTSEVMKQKEEMIHCLQDELIKERLREAENEERIRNLLSKVSDMEQENKRLRESVPENEVASLQEELAAAKLREAEANLALKELRSKVAELSGMWQKHLKRKNLEAKKALGDGADGCGEEGSAPPPSTPKKLLGSLLEAGGISKGEMNRLEEEMMSVRMSEVGAQADLKGQKLKVMELETQVNKCCFSHVPFWAVY